jgi:hypothetical protein
MGAQGIGTFGDKRLAKTGQRLLARMVALSTVHLRKLGGGRADERAFGRFIHNRFVTVQELLQTAAERLLPQARGRHILAIQDTTELNFERHRRRKADFGEVGNGSDIGFFLHPVIAVDAEDGHIMGLCGAEIWQRHKGKASNYKTLPIEQKESMRWLRGAKSAQRALALAAMVTVIADRESDIYEEWCRIPNERTHLLTRACRDRALAEGGALFAHAAGLPVVDRYDLALPALKGRVARTARMAVRYGSVRLKRPANCSDRSAPETIELRLIDVCEENSPPGTEPIHWRLLTTHVVRSLDDALRMVGFYCRRWLIEQTFRTLKRQGLDVESSLIETPEPLEKLAVLAMICAVRTMQVTMARNGDNERPATDAFDEEEITVIQALQPQLEGKTEKQKNHFSVHSLAWAAWVVARLGGWNGYASERPPGPLTMLDGLKRLEGMVLGWRLAQFTNALQPT